MFGTFPACQNNFCEPISFYKGFFIKIQKTVSSNMKTFAPCINLFINSFSASTSTVALIELLLQFYTFDRKYKYMKST